MNNKEIKQKILNSIQQAKKAGYTLVNGDWGDDKIKCACALTCLLVAKGQPITDEVNLLTQELGVSDGWVSDFINGFDGVGIEEHASNRKAWKLGQELKEEARPIEMTQFIDNMDEQET